MSKSLTVMWSVWGVGFFLLTGCASSGQKTRQEQREKVANSAGLYCEWINGDKHSDIDVELNLQMGKRCDSAKPFALTPYKNPSDQNGILYCCAMAGSESRMQSSGSSKKASGPAAQKTAPAATPASTAAPAAEDIVEDK